MFHLSIALAVVGIFNLSDLNRELAKKFECERPFCVTATVVSVYGPEKPERFASDRQRMFYVYDGCRYSKLSQLEEEDPQLHIVWNQLLRQIHIQLMGQVQLAVLGTGEPAFTLTQAQIDFLNAHPELWEAESREDFYNSEYNQQLDRQYKLRNCLQDPDTMTEPRWLIQYSLKVLDVYSGPAFTGGPVITRITAVDDSYQMTVRLLVPGTVDKIAANRRVSFIGLPLQLSSYTTVLGQENTCVVVVAGEILVSG